MNAANRIVVVDDDETFRGRLAVALSRRGYPAMEACGVAEAIHVFEKIKGPVAGCVADLRMPGESGLQLVRWIAANRPGVRVLVLTGFGSIATAVEAMQLGAANYLTKPADADQILDALFAPPAPAAEDFPSKVPSLDRVEWEHLQRVLQQCGGNISGAARVLGIERRTLQRKLQKYPPPD